MNIPAAKPCEAGRLSGRIDEVDDGVCVAVVVAVAVAEADEVDEDVLVGEALFVAEDVDDEVEEAVDEAEALELEDEVDVNVFVDVAEFDAGADLEDRADLVASALRVAKDVSVLVEVFVAE
jgi:hypothetical protein